MDICKSLRGVHGREGIVTGWCVTCRDVDVLRKQEGIYEESGEIGELHRKIWLLEKYEILYDMNEEKLELMKKEMSDNAFE